MLIAKSCDLVLFAASIEERQPVCAVPDPSRKVVVHKTQDIIRAKVGFSLRENYYYFHEKFERIEALK